MTFSVEGRETEVVVLELDPVIGAVLRVISEPSSWETGADCGAVPAQLCVSGATDGVTFRALPGIVVTMNGDASKRMMFREPLPEGCPPADAEEVTGAREVFRLVRTFPPTLDDFRSQRAEKPQAVFKDVTECHARGLSVHAEKADCQSLLKLPHLRNRIVCRVHLNDGAGRIQRTFQRSHHTWWPRSHHTWWPRAEFDILTRCAEAT